jgi:hypothetical protein
VKVFRVKTSFCGLKVGTVLTNVPTQYESILIKDEFIEVLEVKRIAKPTKRKIAK